MSESRPPIFEALIRLVSLGVAVRRRFLGPRRASWSPDLEAAFAVLHGWAGLSSWMPVTVQRRGARMVTRVSPHARTSRFEAARLAGVSGHWCERDDVDSKRVLLYLHGGGYTFGGLDTHRDLVSRLAQACRARVFLLEYRLAPEDPFPAAPEDCLAAYRALLDQGTEPEHLVVGGESAGGGLTLSTLVSARDQGWPLPAAGVLISPWLDLTSESPSIRRNSGTDYLNLRMLEACARAYTTEAERRDPRASPLFAELSGLPPLLVQAGDAEAILDDATRIAHLSRRAGVETTLEVWPDMIHAWHIFASFVPEGDQAIARVGEFVRGHTPTSLGA